MIFRSLASSSAGNAYLLEDGESRLLLECGLPYKKLQKLMDFGSGRLAGCLVTHEHKDHARCFADLLKNGVRVYASEGTAGALENEIVDILPMDEDKEDRYRELSVGSFDVLPFRVFHDAKEPLGYLIRSRADGERMAFATDTVNLRYRFRDLSILAVECNYSHEILERCTRLPKKVVRRIRNSHMELGRLCEWLATLDLSRCRELYLLHLSDACSNEGLFVAEVERCVPGHVRVTACPK